MGKRRPREKEKKRKTKKRIRRIAAVRSLQPLPMVRPERKLSLRLIESCCRTLGKKNKRSLWKNHDTEFICFYETKRRRNVGKESNRIYIYIYINKRRTVERGEVVPTFESPLIAAGVQTEMSISTTVYGMPMGR
ncbi:hypothetical protein CEXT_77311 [Caerostris extrusa]|uniref:Uncharacterized protein n=1 Tax=Caerostris extrusa TaxID=172846 RepID=A0AAV4UAJ6_CAEEX|nr:hypothetical protein CEXT_77311 [Caerostris extrusa]